MRSLRWIKRKEKSRAAKFRPSTLRAIVGPIAKVSISQHILEKESRQSGSFAESLSATRENRCAA